MSVRRANVSDARAIAEVHVATSREIYAGLLPARMLDRCTVDLRADQWRDVIAQSNLGQDDAVFVADMGDALVGFGYCSLQRDPELRVKGFAGEFQAIYLMRSARRRGLGRSLMAEMARNLARRNIRSAGCWVLAQNQAARAFYDALGGTAVEEKAVELGEDAIRTEVAYGWSDVRVLTSDDLA